MSDVITKPGFYRQRDGQKAEIVSGRDGRWIGWDGEDEAESWASNGSWWEEDDSEENPHNRDIVAPWQDPPAFSVGELVLVNKPSTALHQHYGTVEKVSNRHTVRFGNVLVSDFSTEELTRVALPAPVPAGFRLKPRNVHSVFGDQVFESGSANYWHPMTQGGGLCGLTGSEADSKWSRFAPHFFAEPIPVPEPPSPETQWTPTCEQRKRVVPYGTHCSYLIYPHGNPEWVVDEHRWTSGDREEWRAVEVVQ